MPSTLIPSGDLIVGSWVNFRKNIAVYAEFGVWFAALAIIRWAIQTGTSAAISDREMRYTLDILLSLPVFFLHAVLGVAVIACVARHLAGRAMSVRESIYDGLHHVFPVIWTWVAGTAVSAIGLTMAIGGTLTPPAGIPFIMPGIILLIPGTWLAIRWFFGAYAVTIDGSGSNAALGMSAKLVAGRWLDTFWRVAMPWIFFYVAVLFVQRIAFLLAGSVLGNPGLLFAQTATSQDLPNTYRLLKALIVETTDGLALPLFVSAGILLWNDLRRRA